MLTLSQVNRTTPSSFQETTMSALSHPYLLGGGVLLLVIGYWLRSWAAKHDLLDMAKDVAWQVAKNKGDLAAVGKTDIANKFTDLTSDSSKSSQAKKAAGYAARHAIAQIAGLSGLASLLGGAVLIGLAFWLK
jgi:hypothetical protein